ncbi:MAG: ABC transporter permease [Burkholderiales bacterium 28-67-8]|nr:MAG: ABC transporter permease [Burkholderiales bacterium 28-67-8]
MVALARKTLLHEWRRFLPAVVAVAFSGLLLMVQAALVLGIFGSAAVYIEASKGDLWIGYPGTRTIELGRLLPSDTDIWVRLDEAVDRVEPYRWIYGDWRVRNDLGAFSMYVSGIDTSADGLVFAKVLPSDLRLRLEQPDSVIVDSTDLEKLGVVVGDRPRINGHVVEVVGTVSGLRTLGGVNILASLETAGRIQPGGLSDDRVAYYVVRLRDPAQLPAAHQRLNEQGRQHGFQVWTRDEFSKVVTHYWLLETGAGLGVLFLAVVVSVVGAVITSQTLMGAVAGSAAEYAALQALGIGMSALRAVVLEQAAWIGATGIVLGTFGAAAALWLARRHDVPVAVDGWASLGCAALVFGIALVSGWAAVRALRRADPATLLR